MASVIVQQLVSVDGFVSDPDGGLDFHGAVDDFSESDEEQLRMLENVGHILLGADTYRMFVGFWPTEASAGEPVAPRVNGIAKTVVSSTLDDAPWGDFAPATVERRDPVVVARELAASGSGDVVVWGSVQLTRALFRAGVVDELHLTVIPVVLGAGVGVLPDDLGMTRLRLLRSQSFTSGILNLVYSLR